MNCAECLLVIKSSCNNKICSNEKVRNDTVSINEDFIQSVHQGSEHNDSIDKRAEGLRAPRISVVVHPEKCFVESTKILLNQQKFC